MSRPWKRRAVPHFIALLSAVMVFSFAPVETGAQTTKGFTTIVLEERYSGRGFGQRLDCNMRSLIRIVGNNALISMIRAICNGEQAEFNLSHGLVVPLNTSSKLRRTCNFKDQTIKCSDGKNVKDDAIVSGLSAQMLETHDMSGAYIKGQTLELQISSNSNGEIQVQNASFQANEQVKSYLAVDLSGGGCKILKNRSTIKADYLGVGQMRLKSRASGCIVSK